MQIDILKVEASPSETRVRFSSKFGEATARWAGTPPVVAQQVHVELTASAPLTWGSDLLASTNSDHRIEADGNGVVIEATLEAYDPSDGVATLRVGHSLLLVETLGEAPQVGTHLRARIETLTLSDTGI